MKTLIWKHICSPMFTATLFTMAKIWKQPKWPINRWMDKDDVTYTYNGILLSHKKEWHLTICNNMHGPRGYYAKWNVRQRKIPYDITYMWNLKKWYKCTDLQNRNRLLKSSQNFRAEGFRAQNCSSGVLTWLRN